MSISVDDEFGVGFGEGGGSTKDWTLSMTQLLKNNDPNKTVDARE
jgi:hypothetical protein